MQSFEAETTIPIFSQAARIVFENAFYGSVRDTKIVVGTIVIKIKPLFILLFNQNFEK